MVLPGTPGGPCAGTGCPEGLHGAPLHVLWDRASVAFQAHRGPRSSAMKWGLQFPPALVSALEKRQGPHFPQLPVEDLSLFLLLVL